MQSLARLKSLYLHKRIRAEKAVKSIFPFVLNLISDSSFPQKFPSVLLFLSTKRSGSRAKSRYKHNFCGRRKLHFQADQAEEFKGNQTVLHFWSFEQREADPNFTFGRNGEDFGEKRR